MALLAGCVMVLSGGAASAATPSGCWFYSVYNYRWSWQTQNCYVGPGYLNDGNYARLPQWLSYYASNRACSLGIIDGNFGTNSINATKCYQNLRGLTPDGVVGGNTWSRYANDSIVTQCVGSPQSCVYRVGPSGSFGFVIRYSLSETEKDNRLLCTQSATFSFKPFVDKGSTGRSPIGCPGY